jgi:dipeptidyl aminopeptidase/acylaminoacyl peptidase
MIPPEQAEKMYLKLKEKGVDVYLIVFDGEGHGFRKSDTIKNTLETELNFYKGHL